MVFSSLGDQRTRSIGTCNRSYCCAAPEIGIIHQSRWYLCSHLCYANRVNTRFLIPKQILLLFCLLLSVDHVSESVCLYLLWMNPSKSESVNIPLHLVFLCVFKLQASGEQQLFVVICRIYRLVPRSIFGNSFAAVGENSNTTTIVR